MRCSPLFSSALAGVLAIAFSGEVAAVEPVKSAYPANPELADLSKVLIFEEPLVPLASPSPRDVQDLAKALDAYLATGRLEELSSVKQYLEAHPASPWRLSLLVNLGLMQRHVGRVSEALESWEAAWTLGKNLKDPKGMALAHRALGELLEVNAGLGRKDRLEQLLKETTGRGLAGLVTEKLAGAKESLVMMRTSPDRAYRCGPLALTQVQAITDPKAFADPKFEQMSAALKGTTLAMNVHRAVGVGMKLQMAKRAPGSAVLTPSVMHWKTGHFSALVCEAKGNFLVQDPTLGDTWVSRKTLDEESTGYALVKEGSLPSGWSAVPEQEGQSVWGRGAWGPGRPDDTRPDSHKVPAGATAQEHPGIPVYRFHTNLVSLNVDTHLVHYRPARGPEVDFTVTYNQREYGQPQLFDYCNLGPKWTFSYLACLKDDTTNPDFNISVCYPGGGGVIFRSKGDGTYAPEDFTQAVLMRLSPSSYVIRYLDGRQEFYTLADRASGLRRIVLTRITDKTGEAVDLTWDMHLRLVAIKDALGQTTTLSYELPNDILKLTKVVDPFGHTATFEYSAQGYLVRMENVEGKSTRFNYGPTKDNPEAPEDFLNRLVTPEGTSTSFAMGETMGPLNLIRWIEARQSDGRRERLEGGSEYGPVLKNEPIPSIPELNPGALAFRFGYRNSFYWDAKHIAAGKQDYAKAANYQWGHGPGGYASGIVITEKQPEESRIFYVHTGEFWGGIHPMAKAPEADLKPMFEGGRRLVTRRVRLLPSGGTEILRTEYDADGRPIKPEPVTTAPAARP